jgi:hypothetical protein
MAQRRTASSSVTPLDWADGCRKKMKKIYNAQIEGNENNHSGHFDHSDSI